MAKKFVPNNNYKPIELPDHISFRDIYKENYEEHLFGLEMFKHTNSLEVFRNQFPDLLIFGQFDINKFVKYIHKNYKINFANEINEVSIQNEKQFNDPNFAILSNGIVIRFLNIDYRGYKANIYYSKSSSKHLDFIADITKNQHRFNLIEEKIKKNNVSLLIETRNGFSVEEFDVNQENKCDIDKHYNDDFKEVHDLVVKSLNEKERTGIVLMHGDPGTGKTTYIKHLTSILEKRIIIINNYLAKSIDSPQFIPFLMEHRNSILVIEDAENLITSRNKDSYSSVAGLLNMTDGLLGQCLNIQFICTFNTDLDNIDEALMRKGRMITRYNFKKLNKNKANNLLKEMGYDVDVKEDMSLADIFNYGKENNKKNKNKEKIEKIGFKF